MKSILSYAAPLALAMSMNVALPTSAQAASDNKSVHEFCTYVNAILEEQFPELIITFGRCVSYFNAEDAASFCKGLNDFNLLEQFNFTSQGDCVSYLRSLR